MSYFRLYTAPDTFTDYRDFWNLEIGADEIGGATYWQQQARVCSLSLPDVGQFDPFRLDPVKPPLYRLLGEVWEDFQYVAEEGEIETRHRLLFRGYFFQGSFNFNVDFDAGSHAVKTVTIAMFDYLAVLEYFLTHRWEIQLADGALAEIGKPITFYPYDADIEIDAAYRELWGFVPAHPTDPAYPLWQRPPLVIDLQPLPEYGYLHDFVSIWRQNYYKNTPDLTEATIYELDGEAFLEAVQVKWGELGFLGNYYRVWERFRIMGSSLVAEPGFPKIIKKFGFTPDYGEIWNALQITTEGEYGEHPERWHKYDLTYIQSNGAETHYRLERDNPEDFTEPQDTMNLPFIMRASGALNYQVLHTLPVPATATSSDNLNWFDRPILPNPWVDRPYHYPAVVAYHSSESAGWEVKTLPWLQFLLLINFAWLREADGAYRIENRVFMPSTPGIVQFPFPNLVEYLEHYDVSPATYSSGVNFVEDVERYEHGINDYAERIYTRYNRICEFAINVELRAGQYVQLPDRFNPNPIQILSVDYDPQIPFVWRCTGRSL